MAPQQDGGGAKRRKTDKGIQCLQANKICQGYDHCYNCGAGDQLTKTITALLELVEKNPNTTNVDMMLAIRKSLITKP